MEDWRRVVVRHLTVESLVYPQISRGLVEAVSKSGGEGVPNDEVSPALELEDLVLGKGDVGRGSVGR